ncbi:flagellar type III secretion system protein FliR [Cohnella lubricantis]|uniref:Flagellar biosynthetic protein FliR n=2 Tax=Cohnella lubricantis TaxID=2163172 RepID=A0A841TJM3_9BACL|nr:flagellar biosynthetic protein FliR [Cohnella lubricantis]MBB6679400.1 flagellar type III secretion system protein FliR [Cohnella lubricantis]
MDLIMQLVPGFMLVLSRMTAFLVVAPVFSSRTFPRTLKIGFAFFLSLIVFLNVGFDTAVPTDGTYIIALFKEILAGLLIGFAASLFFSIVQVSGSLMDMQMGLGVANIVDPMTGVSAPMLGNLKYMLQILVFLSINGHHYLLSAIMDSYKWLPLDNTLFADIASGSVTQFLSRTFADTFLMALQISAPMVVAMFLIDLGLALLSRAAPQYQVFVIGIPIKILLGLAILLLLLPAFSALFQMIFDQMFSALDKLFVVLKA